MDFDWSVIWSAMPELMKGTRLTLYIAIVGLLLLAFSAMWYREGR